MKIYLGADHRGFTLKEQLKEYLKSQDVTDLTHNYDENDDYPEIAQAVATKVSRNDNTLGILICGSGVGVDIAANKIKGARAGLALNPQQVKEAKEADNVNILALAADYTSPQNAKELVDTFIKTQYKPEPRRQRRLEEIEKIEK